MQALQQAISDHEPEFTSLKNEAEKLCNGPAQEAEHFHRVAQLKAPPAGRDSARPGKEQQSETLADYETRLDALKKRFSDATSELNSQLEKGTKFQSGLADLSGWLAGLGAEMNDLKIHSPKSSVIESQQAHCQV